MDDFGRFELVELLAVRGASELFVVNAEGEDDASRTVVLKRLRDDAQSATFVEDAKLAQKLTHPKIVETIEVGRVGNAPYIALEYVDGVDLLGLLQHLAGRRITLDQSIAAWIAREVLDALHYVHSLTDDAGRPMRLVHGRLSPSKVLLGTSGEVKLCDFGAPRRTYVERGSEYYSHMSPEQIMELPTDARSDVFSVGVLLAEMLTSRRLFGATNDFDILLMVRDVRIQRFTTRVSLIDPQLIAIVRKALVKRPDDRWPTVAAFREALDSWLLTKRVYGSDEQLAKVVREARADVDRWRREGKCATREFDDVGLELVPARPMTVAPPRETAKGTTEGMKPLSAADERAHARGTVDPKTKALARGTEPARPLPKPQRPKFAKEPIPPLTKIKTPPLQRSRSHGALGTNLEAQLPERAPVESTKQTMQLLTPRELREAGQPPLPVLPALEDTPSDQGDLSHTPPLRVLFQLMRTRASGLLSVCQASLRKDIYLHEGQLAGVWSNDANELFGNYLATQHVLSEGELAMTLATMSHYGGKIGDTLVGLGLLTHVDVFRHLTRHARLKLVDICTWNTGTYAWYAGATDTLESFPLETEGFTMLGQGALAIAPSVIGEWVTKHRTRRLVRPTTLRVSPDVFGVRGAAAVFDEIDGVRTVRNIIDDHSADRLHVSRVLYLLVACDLVGLG